MEGYFVDERYVEPAWKAAETSLGRLNKVSKSDDYLRNRAAGVYPYNLPYYQYPELYFMAKEQNGRRLLRCLGTSLELDLDDRWTRGQQEQIAQRFGLEMDLWQGRWQRHVLETLFNYLTQLQFSSYYEKLLKFKWDCQVLQFTLFDDYGRIKKVNGRLYGLVHSRKDKEQCEWRLLTVPTVERELQVLGGVDRASNRLKQKLAEELRQLHEDQAKERSHYQVSYAEGGLRYIDTLGQAEFCSEPTAPFDCQAYVHVGDMRSTPRPSQQLKDCLYRLTGGNLEQLDQLAELFARVLVETMPSGVVWTLCGKGAGQLLQLLHRAVEGKASGYLYRSLGTRVQETQEMLLYDGLAHCLLQFNECYYQQDEFEKLNHSRLQETVRTGISRELEDPFVGEETVTYCPVVLYVSGVPIADGKQYFKKVPYRMMEIPDGWDVKCISEEDLRWLRSCFVVHGLNVLRKPEGTLRKAVELTTVLKQFVDLCCAREAEARTNCKAFHEALSAYAQTIPDCPKIPGSTKLKDEMKSLFGWENREDNREGRRTYAYWDVRMDQSKLNAYLDTVRREPEDESGVLERDEFEHRLDEMCGLITNGATG